ncbi:thiamine-phosphate kinase [Candidatus Methylacidithermus pantelleriae]|uniref:Thiamine-monophosphate kinase n=1 Tax=Candidatus Methylacidithermus pantelleriae TaxID=2744239 RepID=A0A8J2FNT7_9BACT|nr:thiamine-phosphate kinase [Candidatus Methylacidithermus pantelleriae]CAF0698029.1 Thiamine-monophosphate kinase [Candidatus Methylacidithermus pantelleriae]
MSRPRYPDGPSHNWTLEEQYARCRLHEIGEKRLIQILTRHWKQDRGVLRALEEDCAVFRGLPDQGFWLLKIESVVEGVHFTKGTPFFLVGRKALARALSDLAAMGAIPRYAMVALAASPRLSLFALQRLYEGMERLAKAYRLFFVGGETVRSDALLITVSLLGHTPGYRPVLRCGARPGDSLFVTGELGGSFPTKHLVFEPRLREGQWLAQNRLARAMIDLSDGLASDLSQLARASGVSFELDFSKIPRRPGISLSQALQDGEDYELLFAVAPAKVSQLQKQWPFRTKLTCIGLCHPADPKASQTLDAFHGFDHFA